jgi:AmpD protein
VAIFLFVFFPSQKKPKIVINSNNEKQAAKERGQEKTRTEEEWPITKKEDPEKKLVDASQRIDNQEKKGDSSEKQKSIQKDKPKKETSASTETKNESNFIQPHLVNWGYQKANERQINTIIIHSSYDALHKDPYDLDGLLEEYQKYKVAPHFVIDREGGIFQLVDTAYIAYHAGESQMPDGRENINAFSIGVELMNTKEDEYTSKQYESLNKLVEFLEKKYDIQDILGHQDIAPERKTDPWNFDWAKLESKNITF